MATIQLRRGTTADWEASARVPALGEPCVDTDTGELRIGNGVNLFSDLPSVNGSIGPQGPQGEGVPNPTALPDGYGLTTDGGEWVAGPGGGGGGSAREIQMQKSATHIQWRYVGDAAWTNLVALADLKGTNGTNGSNGAAGAAGAAVQMRVNGGFFQWKLATDVAWTNLIAVSELGGSGNVRFLVSGAWQARGASPFPVTFDAGNAAAPPWPSDIVAGDHTISKNPMVAP